MPLQFKELPTSPELTASYLIAAADKDEFEREFLGRPHEWAAWLRAVDVQFIQPADEQGDAPLNLVAVVLYQPDRDNSLFPDERPPAPAAFPAP